MGGVLVFSCELDMLAVVTPWSSSRLALRSYVKNTGLEGQERYEWWLPKEEFYAQLRTSYFNPWRYGLPEEKIVFPLVWSVADFENAILLRFVAQRPVFYNTKKCPMQQIVGSFNQNDSPPQIGGGLLAHVSQAAEAHGRTLTIIPTHDLYVANCKALFRQSDMYENWFLEDEVVIGYDLFTYYYRELIHQKWDAVYLDRVPLQHMPSFHAECIWIVTMEEVEAIVLHLMRIYRIDFDVSMGIDNLVKAIKQFKCFLMGKLRRKKIHTMEIMSPLEPYQGTIDENEYVLMSMGNFESPTGIKIRMAKLSQLPSPPTHYLDMVRDDHDEEHDPAIVCNFCHHYAESPTRNLCCDHYFCFACLNNYCLEHYRCPTCYKEFGQEFRRGSDRDVGIQYRFIEPPRHFLPPNDVQVILENLRIRGKTILFSHSMQFVIEPLNQLLCNMACNRKVDHTVITDPYTYDASQEQHKLLLMHQSIVPFFKHDPSIKHVIGVRYNPRDDSFLYHFPSAKITMMI